MSKTTLFASHIGARWRSFLGAVVMAVVFSCSVQSARSLEVPAGTNLEVRLLNTTGSRVSHQGDPIRAIVVTPVMEEGAVTIPQGSILSGTVGTVHRLGFAIKHTTASIEFNLNSLQLPQSRALAFPTQVVEVETAKERVNARGVIGGIHPMANLSSGVSVFISAVLMQPGLAVPVLGVKFLLVRSPDPEIFFPAGTELIVQTKQRLFVPRLTMAAAVLPNLSAEDDTKVQRLLAKLPQQTEKGLNRPSDLVNVLFLGTPTQMDRAFEAAGWAGVQGHSPVVLYRMFHSLVQRNPYRAAPMANLTLDGVPQRVAYQKSLDTFAKRHHIRLWGSTDQEVWVGAASEDVSFAREKMHVTHASDLNIDNERAKVVNDLALTGCLHSASLYQRDGLHVESEGTQAIVTDGRVAVVRLSDCTAPQNVISEDRHPVPSRIRHISGVVARDVMRSNPLSLGYGLTRTVFGRSSRDAATGTPGTATLPPVSVVAEAPAPAQPLAEAPGVERRVVNSRRKEAAAILLLSNRWKRPSVVTAPAAFRTAYTSSSR